MSEENGHDTSHKMDFDTLLISELGQFGKFQVVTILLIAIPAMCAGFMAGDYIFTAAKLPHRCAVPECDEPRPIFKPDWITNAIPIDDSGNIEDCRRYGNKSTWINNFTDECPASMFDSNTLIPCDSFVYERSNSAVFDFGLECQEWLRALAGTLNSLGAMFGLPFAGFISDRWGRRTSVLIYGFNLALIGFVRSFSVNYIMYTTLQFLQTALGGGVYSAGYVLATEVVGLKYRVRTSAIMSSMFACGQAILGLIAAFVTEWRTLSIVLYSPIFLIVSYYWLLPESPRWLISKNKFNEAKKIINKMARMNNKTVTEKSINALMKPRLSSNQNANENAQESLLFMRVIRSPILLRRCCITPVWWMATTFIYYGLSINSVSLSGNMYINYIASALIEIPGYWTALLLLDKIGRKVTLFGGYMLNAACCIAFAFVPTGYPNLSLLLYLVGKFCISVVFTSLYLYTSELYPTRHRHSLLAFSSTIGRIGSVISPLTPPLMAYWRGIPSVLFGSVAFISGLLVLTQPETLGIKLPDTIEDAEVVGK